MKEVFIKVEVAVQSKNSKEAYAKLCDLLYENGIEFETSTYSEDGKKTWTNTEVLWPKDEAT